MYECPLCSARVRTTAQLWKHRRDKHPRYRGVNRRAADATIAALVKTHRLEAVNDAAVQAVRSIADVLDFDPTNAQMWRTYREALNDLLHDDGGGDAFDELIAQINRAAEVGDKAKTRA